MVGRRRDIEVVGEKWQKIPPDAVNLRLFTRDHLRNVRQWHLTDILSRGHRGNAYL